MFSFFQNSWKVHIILLRLNYWKNDSPTLPGGISPLAEINYYEMEGLQQFKDSSLNVDPYPVRQINII